MKKDNLLIANNFVREEMNKSDDTFRPKFHISPPVGWINDVNGFVFFKEKYHLYAQYYPYDTQWGPTHWGHWTSEDLIIWNWESVVLAPEDQFDNFGNYSGTSIVEQGKIFSMYTGVHSNQDVDVTDKGKRKSVEEIRETSNVLQEQSIAFSHDGYTFEKYPDNPVILGKHLPEGFTVESFRDPKLYYQAGKYYSFIAAKKSSGEDRGGYILVYDSTDRVNWDYFGTLLGPLGSMIECPDYFTLESYKVIVACIMDNENSEKIQIAENDYPVIYMCSKVSELETTNLNKDFNVQSIGGIDLGFNFYAPQTLGLSDGRRVMIGWLQSFEHSTPLDYLDCRWNGAMSLPRELYIEDDQLLQKPISEIYSCMLLKQEIDQSLSESSDLLCKSFKNSLMKIQFPKTDNAVNVKLLMNKKQDEYFEFFYYMDQKSLKYMIGINQSNLKLPIKRFGSDKITKNITEFFIEEDFDNIDIEIFIDNCIVEIFVNNKYVFTSWAFTEDRGDNLKIKTNSENLNIKVEIFEFQE